MSSQGNGNAVFLIEPRADLFQSRWLRSATKGEGCDRFRRPVLLSPKPANKLSYSLEGIHPEICTVVALRVRAK